MDDESEELTPEDAFTILGNETRVSALEALWESWGDGPVPFSELRRQVGMRDGGQFHYHLRKLRDHYVTKSDDGYELTQAGFKIAQAVVAGVGIERPTVDQQLIDAKCPRCDSDVTFSYSRGQVRVRCPECPGFWTGTNEWGEEMAPGMLGSWEFPPAGIVDRDPKAALAVAIVHLLTRTEAFLAGACPDCGGETASGLNACPDHDADEDLCESCGQYFLATIGWRCQHCHLQFGGPSWAAVVDHPQVRGLLAERDITLAADPWAYLWVWYRDGWEESLASSDPPRVEITLPADQLTLSLDEAGHITTVSE